MALAIHMQQLIDEGVVRDYAELPLADLGQTFLIEIDDGHRLALGRWNFAGFLLLVKIKSLEAEKLYRIRIEGIEKQKPEQHGIAKQALETKDGTEESNNPRNHGKYPTVRLGPIWKARRSCP